MDEPFVGRTVELAELERQFALAAAGQGRVVLLAGPAGIGKTALARRCAAAWAPRADIITISGDEAEVIMSGGLLGQLTDTSTTAAADLVEILSVASADPLTEGSALLSFLRRRASTGALVLVVDDAHWGDELSLQALSFALRWLRDSPVLSVIATRSDGLARLPSGLTRAADERGRRLDLAGLDAGDVALLAGLAGAGRLSGRAAERLREHTAGIPLHVTEMLHDLPGETLRTPGFTLPVPRSLQTLVLSRLAACAPDTEALVLAAAVLGAECVLADAAGIAGLADPLPALQEAMAHRLLTEPQTAGRRRCSFPHATIRAAVYQDIGVSRRAALHRAAAELTSGIPALGHRVAGCTGTDARLAADLAAQASAERAAGQLTEAAEHLLMAVRVAESGPEADSRLFEAVGLLIEHGDAARARGYAGQVAAAAPSPLRSLLLGRLELLAGATMPAEQLIAGAWAATYVAGMQPADDQARDSAAKAACDLALVLIGQHRLRDAASWAERAASAAASAHNRACARAVQGISLAIGGRARRAKMLLEAELRQCTDPAGRAHLHGGLGTALLYGDDLAGAALHLTAAATADAGAGMPMVNLLDARLLQVLLCYRNGNWDQAAADGDRLVTLIDDLDQGWLLARAHLAAVYVAAGRGQWQAATGHADAAALRLGAGVGAVALAEARTAIAVARDDPAAIVLAAENAASDPGLLGRTEPGRLLFWPAYAQALARIGRHTEADRVLRPFERRAATCGRRSALAAAGRARGILLACGHDVEGALAAFDASLANLAGLGMPMEEGMTRFERGRLLRRVGQRRAGARDIGAARLLFLGLRAEPFVQRCELELGAEPSVVAGPSRPPLTARQLLVAWAAADGKSNRQIAADLFISVKTVEFHLGQILARLDLDSRAQIADALATLRATGNPREPASAAQPTP